MFKISSFQLTSSIMIMPGCLVRMELQTFEEVQKTVHNFIAVHFALLPEAIVLRDHP